MSEREKPPIKKSIPPQVTVEGGEPESINQQKDDIFFAAIQTTRMPMLVTDPRQPDNPIIFANRAFVSMTGYSEEEIHGSNCRFLQGPETDRDSVSAIKEAIEDIREISVEILNYKKDGTAFWNALYISPVFDQNDKLVYFFASQLDVSRRREAEDALAQAQKMEALGQLTGGISHDFNNLLQVMSGHLDIMEMREKSKTPTDKLTVKSVDNIRSAVNKASTLTQQLLAFSRKQTLRGRTLNINTVIKELADLVKQTLGADIDIQMNLSPVLANCTIDATQMETAILNILVNARDSMVNGGSVIVKTENHHIQTEDIHSYPGMQAGQYVSISVSDTGSGIPANILTKVMDPFFTTKDEGKGTGLGLSMVYGFARQSGGGATIYSEVGLGTTVRMYFPATKNTIRTTPARSVAENRGGSEKILVVDDRPEVGELSRDMLEGLGYSVMVAQSGKEALSLVAGLSPDNMPELLFSDLIMPGGINGFTLAREMRAFIPSIKILLTTGYAGKTDGINTSYGLEFEILKKPYRLSELARRVRYVLDGPPDPLV